MLQVRNLWVGELGEAWQMGAEVTDKLLVLLVNGHGLAIRVNTVQLTRIPVCQER